MMKLRSLLAAAALALPGAALAQTCLTSNAGFQNAAFAAKTAAFELTFDAKPNAAKMDGVTGFSGAPATGFAGMAAIIRFNDQGLIDARDGATYRAAQAVPYTAGATYKFQVRIDPIAKRYSVYVAPPGGSLRTLASNFAFRTEQAGTSSVGYWSLSATAGSHQVCNMSLGGSATGGAAGDTSAPKVNWYSPSAGATVAGTQRVEVTASDDKGVAGVQFKLDGVSLGAEDTSAPYAVAWDTTKSAAGGHTLTATARDAAGNRTTTPTLAVTVKNTTVGTGDTTAPQISWLTPAAGATLSGTVRVETTASDDKGVAGVQFQLDGVALGAEDTAAPFAVAWDTSKSAAGAHTLTATARDAAGNKASAGARSVTVAGATTVSGGAASVRQIYPSLSGGKFWVSKWDNGVARTMISGAYDPNDSWLRARGDGTHKIDGKGLLKMSGAAPRLYIVDPGQGQWRNVEMTVYAMRVSDGGGNGGIVGVARTNHTSPDANLCDSRGTGARIHYTGVADFHKETAHHTAESVQSVSYKTLWSGGMPYNKWIGYKYIVYDQADGNVKMETWMDLGETGVWTKVNEFIDNGKNLGVGITPCKTGIDPAMRLTKSESRLGSETGKPNLAVYFRSDLVNTDGLIYKKMSVREIQP